ncbi:hypothetical protein KJ819_02540 [Patescibacteria group bacterium]|nr:hypothetical protein [Patescibacteria group bacterium]MBU1500839.1 hypothetical protein [Patescibacteria group bacterium]MBU2080894.1 hypothetical protein [Patescibacteria group bacterium]MBU2123999.1 hypothetical protein [Patescibacteria group bacterium]MBU2194710.1 hypothetical protein [Patescibacteria group bacterium]
MKWNPFINAIAAAVYIGIIVLFMQFIESIRHDTPDTILDGIGVLSLFVLSVAVMAFLFFYQPVVRFVDNKRTEAVSYFLKTLGIFAVITIVILTLVSAQ